MISEVQRPLSSSKRRLSLWACFIILYTWGMSAKIQSLFPIQPDRGMCHTLSISPGQAEEQYVSKQPLHSFKEQCLFSAKHKGGIVIKIEDVVS